MLDAEPETNAIITRITEGMSSEFRASLAGLKNPYGDGHAAETIVRVLASTSLSGELLVKHAPANRRMKIPLSAPDITEAEIEAVAERVA